MSAAFIVVVLGFVGAITGLTRYESYTSLYDAEYVGAAKCGECHTQVYEQWRTSPHALMVQEPSRASVVGDFEEGTYAIPPEHRRAPGDERIAARMYRDGDAHYMALRQPGGDEYVPFAIDYVVGFQYRQVYLHREAGGVLRRLPLQWSTRRQAFFPYWNLQEGSPPSVQDLWDQMRSQNSAWNLFCARCHVTHLEVLGKDRFHTQADTRWVDKGIACEACHGPGSQHVNYFAHNYVNRVAAFVNNKLRGQPAAYIANGPKLTAGQDLSVCARCHGPDIMMASTEVYRVYEPGYSRQGRVNDLSPHFKEFPLQPGRKDPTVECWDDGRPKGIGMLFRSFIESACADGGEIRCYDCHDPHANKLPSRRGILEAGPVSDGYCTGCHTVYRDPLAVAEHTKHTAGTSGSFCYDCHMPHELQNLVGGYEKFTRTHTMSSIPDPASSIRHGLSRAPNACNECHGDQTPQWALETMQEWWSD